MNKIKIIGIDCQLGSKEISLGDIANRFGITPEKITKKSGITKLYALSESESLLSIGVDCVERLLENKKIEKTKVSGIFGSTNLSTETLIPTFTIQLASVLGFRNIIADQVGLGCVGGIQALKSAYNQLMVDTYLGKISYYLVVAGDATNRILDPDNFGTSILFSEGFGAMIITNDPTCTDGYKINTVSTKSFLTGDITAICLKSPFRYGDQSVEMNGKILFRFGTTILDEIMKCVDVSLENFKQHGMYLVSHQPNLRMLESLMNRYQLTENEMYIDGIKTIGNTSGPATFFGLKDVIERRLVNEKQEIILGAFGAELQVGGVHLIPCGCVNKII